MQGSNVVEGFGLAGQAERLLALPGPFHIFNFFCDLLSKLGLFLDRSTLMSVISRATCATEKLYTSLESPHIQLFGGLKTWGVALQSKHPRPF